MSSGPGLVTRRAPHVRHPACLPRLLVWYVLATLPAAAAGLWARPSHLLAFAAQASLALAVCAAWERLFSRVRQQPGDSAWLVHGWLFALLVPPDTPPLLVAAAISFGVIVGHHVFGGTGRALVSPPLLGALAVHLGYPSLADPAGAPGLLEAAQQADAWQALLTGSAGAVGSGSALACALGALLLIRVGAASARVVLGAVLGVFLASLLTHASSEGAPAPAWYQHLVIGNFAFCVAFIATDPSTAALTRVGRWAHGLLSGALTVAIRWLDPTHPDGALFAVLMAGLTVPLVDHLAGLFHAARLRRRLSRPRPETRA